MPDNHTAASVTPALPPREQAREACRNIEDIDGSGFATEDDYADAASDVWEPLVRDLLAAVDSLGAPVGWRHDATVERIRNALGHGNARDSSRG